MNEINKITDEELASFLQGSLPEDREIQVAEAINNDKQLQAIVEAAIDIDSSLMFDELCMVKRNPQVEDKSVTLSFVTDPSNTDSKWGKYLSPKSDFGKDPTSWEEEEYRRAADKEENKLTKLRSQKRVKKEDPDGGKNYWIEIIIGIIIMIVFMIVRSCIG